MSPGGGRARRLDPAPAEPSTWPAPPTDEVPVRDPAAADAGIVSLLQLSEFLLAFQPQASGLAASRCKPRDLTKIMATVELMAVADDPLSVTQAHIAFQRAIAAASGNIFFQSMGNLIEPVLLTLLAHNPASWDAAFYIRNAHDCRLAAEAIGRRQPDLAQSAMRTVLRRLFPESAGDS